MLQVHGGGARKEVLEVFFGLSLLYTRCTYSILASDD